MLIRPRCLLLAGVLWSVGGMANVAYAEEPVWKKNPTIDVEIKPVSDIKAAVPPPSVPVPEPIAAPSPTINKSASPSIIPAPYFQGSSKTAKCAEPIGPIPAVQIRKSEHPPLGSYLERFSRWFFYRSPQTACECHLIHTPYRPPLYTWGPFPSAQCSNFGNGCKTMVFQVAQQPGQTDLKQPQSGAKVITSFKLPTPAVPKLATTERPFIPGSATAINEGKPANASGAGLFVPLTMPATGELPPLNNAPSSASKENPNGASLPTLLVVPTKPAPSTSAKPDGTWSPNLANVPSSTTTEKPGGASLPAFIPATNPRNDDE